MRCRRLGRVGFVRTSGVGAAEMICWMCVCSVSGEFLFDVLLGSAR